MIVSDYDKGVVTDRLADRVLSACAKKKIAALVKPKWSRLPIYRGAAAIVCNRKEAEFLVTRSLRDDAAIEDAGRRLLAHFACPAVVITRGEQGLSLFEEESRGMFQIPATSLEQPIGSHGAMQTQQGRQVFDVTGAGDTVLAALALAVAAGGSIREGAILGNAAAGVVISKLGTATLSLGRIARRRSRTSCEGARRTVACALPIHRLLSKINHDGSLRRGMRSRGSSPRYSASL